MRNEKIIQQFPKKLPGTFWGITSYFNPAKYKNKIENYRKFRESSKKQGLNLISVELAFGNEPFELTKKDADILIQVRSNSILWQKERLLNIGLKHLPKDCDKVAWLDCDILFMNNNWIQESSSLLEKYKVIQLFSFLINSSKKSDLERLQDFPIRIGRNFYGYAYGIINFFDLESQIYPGGAWAARKEDLVKCKFYDRLVVGGGDLPLANSFFVNNNLSFFDKFYDKLNLDISNWAEKINKEFEKSVYYLDNIGVHLWHGEIKNREYNKRYDILKKYNFDPNKDIKLNKDECWEWATDKTELKEQVKDYFLKRKENQDVIEEPMQERIIRNHPEFIPEFPKKLPGTFWGITSYFNPAKYKNKIENYRKFRESSKKQGLNLISVELAFGNEPFELTKKDADILIQVRSNSILWQKERLLNIGLKHLPKDCDKVAWLDCDILFMNNNWIQESSSLLEKYKVIQLFSFLIRDSKKSIKDFFKIPFGRIDGQKYEGFSYGLINSCEASKQTNPGGAWAARKEDLVKCKFYDRFILNSGDVLQALMFFNEPFSKIFDGLLNINIKKDISSWMKNSKMIKKSVYYLDNIGVHLWHGDMKNRQYYQKADILKKYNFDPNKDIKLNKDECWEWATDKTGLHNEFKLLFGDRLEDREGLTKMLEKAKKNKREDISVIIPVRNREAFRLSNVIKSIRNQDYPGGLIQIYVVDYGSNEDYSTQYKTICNKNNIRMIHVSNNLRWNKSHALNIAIKEVKTKYLLISDVDILFEENYISTVINEIKKDLYQVVLCRPLDSPREIDFSNKDITKSYNLIKSMCKYRGSKKESNYLYGTGIAFSLTLFFKWIRGYDENYLIWGAEDDDLIKRFNLLGLKTTYITDKSSYIHQWHEKYANLEQEKKEIRDQIKINKYYYHNNNSIIRNIQGYGKY